MSIAIHIVLLALQFDTSGHASMLPEKRRAETSDLSVVLVNSEPTSVESRIDTQQPASGANDLRAAPKRALPPAPPAPPASDGASRSVVALTTSTQADALAKLTPPVKLESHTPLPLSNAARRFASPPLRRPKVGSSLGPSLLSRTGPDSPAFRVPSGAGAPAESAAASQPQESNSIDTGTEALDRLAREEAARELSERQARETAMKAAEALASEEAARRETALRVAAALDAARLDLERREAVQAEAARSDALQRDAAAKDALVEEAARKSAALQELARMEAVQQEAARQEAARQEAARQEAARQEAARQEAARQEAARQEAARQEAARQEAARQEAARQEASRHESGRPEKSRGPNEPEVAPIRGASDGGEHSAATNAKNGNPEGAANATPRPVATKGAGPAPAVLPRSPDARPVLPVPPPPLPDPRRRTLVARTDRNVVLTMFAEGWRQRVELNGAIDALDRLKSKAHVDPIVTVAIRSDGSVESVVFDRTSGVPEIDDAIRTIVQKLAPYAAFPPDLASDYDVIEIRRVWTFETALRLFAGGR